MSKVILDEWISNSSDEYSDLWSYDPPADQQIEFANTWSEAEFRVKVEVDLETGKAKVIEFDGRKLED